MIRIKPKNTTGKKLKKLEKNKSKKDETKVTEKKSKAVKHSLRSSGASKTIKKKKAGGKKFNPTKDHAIKKVKQVLAKLNEPEEPEDTPFPSTIDLQKHIKLAPKHDSKLSLSKDSIEMIKQSDGLFTSISSVLDSGDKELGIDEMLEKKKEKPKLYSGLPGWGNWANTRTIHKVQTVTKPKTRHEEQKKKRVYVAELPSKNKHQVSEVPFPFVSVADYESSIRANFSQEFNSRRVHQILSKSKKKVEMELDEQ